MHQGFCRVLSAALAVAAVVEKENIQAGIVESFRRGERVAHRAAFVMEHKDGGLGGRVAGHPPAGELRLPGDIRAEAHGSESKLKRSWGLGDDAGGMEDELRLAVVEEKAHGDVGAEQAEGDHGAKSFQQPDGIHNFEWSGRGGWSGLPVAG